MIFTISPEKISKVDNLSSALKLIFAGVELLLSIVVRGLLKKSLNKFTFTKTSGKLITHWQWRYQWNLSTICQYSNRFPFPRGFWSVLGSVSLFARHSGCFSLEDVIASDISCAKNLKLQSQGYKTFFDFIIAIFIF